MNKIQKRSAFAILCLALPLSGAPASAQCADAFPVGSPGVSGGEAHVKAIATFDDGGGDRLYAGGSFTTIAGVTVNHIARMEGASWVALGGGMNGQVRALAIYDDGSGPALCVGGDFTTAGGVSANHIAKWNGVTWSALGAGVSGPVYSITSADVGGGSNLYVGGTFTTAGGASANNIAMWNGTTWSALGGGLTIGAGGGPVQVRALTEFDDGLGGGPALIAGGNFLTAGGASILFGAKWSGSGWSAMSGGPGNIVRAMEVWDDDLAGPHSPALYAFGQNITVKWDGLNWSLLPAAGAFPDGDTFSMAVFDDGSGPALYQGSNSVNAHDQVSGTGVFKWNGSSWSPVWPNISMTCCFGIQALAVGPSQTGSGVSLYMGGAVTAAGGIPSQGLVEYRTAGAAPVNDEAPGAIVAPAGTAPWSVALDTSCATTSACPANCTIEKDVWYRIEAPSCLDITASVSGASFTAMIAVYEGTDCASSAIVTCGASPRNFQAEGGRVYLVRVGAANATGGTGTFDLARGPILGSNSCPPPVSPLSTRVYSFVGPANNTSWAWALTSCSFCGLGDFHVPPVATGTAHQVVQAFAASINAAGCTSPNLTATSVDSYTSTGEPKGLLTVSLLGASGCTPVPFTLGVGPEGGPIDCYPSIVGGCPVNPMMYEVPLSGLDCNANGEDDVIDIGTGTSDDLNGNLVPDECESGVLFCFGDGTQATPCPCGNSGSSGRGCENSGSTGGALLSASGTPSLDADTLVLTSVGERPTALSIFLQGTSEMNPGVPYGDGVRCVGGTLKRLYVKNATSGTVSAPASGDPSVSVRSAMLGDSIPQGAIRRYQVYYRDPVSFFCQIPTGNTWNVSSGVSVTW